MAWGIGGDAGLITHKLQDEDLRTQLLQQELAQRMQQFQGQQALAQQRLTQDASQHQSTIDLQDRIRRDRANQEGVDQMDRQAAIQMKQTEMDREAGKERAMSNLSALIPMIDRKTPQGRAEVTSQLARIDPRAAAQETLKETPEEAAAREAGERSAANKEWDRRNAIQEADIRGRPVRSPGGELTDQGLTAAAMQYATTGSMPPLGMSSGAMRSAIINKAAELFPGINPGANAGDFSANKGSLTNITKQLDGITAYEKTALKNLDVFLTQAKGIKDTGSPYLNTPVRKLDERLLGSPQMTAFQTARMVVLPEFARIITNPNLTGILSDSARKEIEELVKGDATLPQIEAAARVLKQDAANRRESLSTQRDAIQGRMRGSQGGTSPEQTPAPDADPLGIRKKPQ